MRAHDCFTYLLTDFSFSVLWEMTQALLYLRRAAFHSVYEYYWNILQILYYITKFHIIVTSAASFLNSWIINMSLFDMEWSSKKQRGVDKSWNFIFPFKWLLLLIICPTSIETCDYKIFVFFPFCIKNWFLYINWFSYINMV